MKNFEKEKTLIENALKKYLNSFPCASPSLRQAMKYALFSGGKRIRPVLALESCRACGGKIEKAIPVACAVEFIHNFSLVHDDLPSLDNDDLRRGKPTCHRKFGEALALLAGDALLNLAYGALSGLKDKQILGPVIKEFSDAIGAGGMIGGQVLDIKYQNKNISQKKQNLINRLKTAALFSSALKAGAIASGTSRDNVSRMHRFGIKLGFAFQVADDIIDRKYRKHQILEAKKLYVKRLLQGAKAGIASFGKRADGLRAAADLIAKRANID